MKICVDCDYFNDDGNCLQGCQTEINPVTGNRRYVTEMRASTYRANINSGCGPDGVYYKKKPFYKKINIYIVLAVIMSVGLFVAAVIETMNKLPIK